MFIIFSYVINMAPSSHMPLLVIYISEILFALSSLSVGLVQQQNELKIVNRFKQSQLSPVLMDRSKRDVSQSDVIPCIKIQATVDERIKSLNDEARLLFAQKVFITLALNFYPYDHFELLFIFLCH